MKRIAALLIVTALFGTARAAAALENGIEAVQVLGQPDFQSAASGTSSLAFTNPSSVYTDGRRLVVNERTNNRVLIYHSIPKTDFAPADVVVGQANFTSSAIGVTRTTFNGPDYAFFDGQKLFVADRSNHRVLIYNSLPVSNGAAADVVLGQPDFTSNVSNNGGVSRTSLSQPRGIFSDGKRLIVVDIFNNRVLVWNSIPTVNNAPADVVIGQRDFVSSGSGTAADRLNVPVDVYYDGRRLFVAEFSNNRVLIYDSIPTVNSAAADVVIGQPDFTSSAGGSSKTGLSAPHGVFSDGKRLFVAEFFGNRVMIWNSIPERNGAPADNVLGQSDFGVTISGVQAASINGPVGLHSDGRRLYVPHFNANRVTVFDLTGASSADDLGPQFTQGKAVLGKVFEDANSNGIQDKGERGVEGVKVASDTGIYAVTDFDGKYHFPYIETGQRILKIDPSSLPDGTTFTTESPRKTVVTEGILTKISFGVLVPLASEEGRSGEQMLRASIVQDPVLLNPNLSVRAEIVPEGILFKIICNYSSFVEGGELMVYGSNMDPIARIGCKTPLASEILMKKEKYSARLGSLYYQFQVRGASGDIDRTRIGRIELSREEHES